MREPIIFFDIAALLIVIFLLFGMFSKKLYRSSSSKAYIIMIIILGITTIFDSFSCFNHYISIDALFIGTTFYHLFRNILLNRLLNRLNIRCAIILESIIFAFFHNKKIKIFIMYCIISYFN